jgi:hypothetical protein
MCSDAPASPHNFVRVDVVRPIADACASGAVCVVRVRSTSAVSDPPARMNTLQAVKRTRSQRVFEMWSTAGSRTWTLLTIVQERVVGLRRCPLSVVSRRVVPIGEALVSAREKRICLPIQRCAGRLHRVEAPSPGTAVVAVSPALFANAIRGRSD